MKHLFSLLAAAMLASAAWAQTTVTLTVDMTNEMVSMDGVHVAGNFQGWDPAATPMTDNGDGTWSYTFTSDTAASYQYKFVNGNAWGTDEGVPVACAVDGNRGITVDGMMGDVSAEACFGNCAACGMTTVRFRVDMANEEVSPFGVHVAGSFNAWSFDGLELLDDDGDMVYEVIYSWDAGTDTSIVYKFVNGNSTADLLESVEGDCSDPAEPQFGNRYLALDASDIVVSANESGSPYCFNSCGSCVAPLAVTFNIDMSVVASVSENGVHLAGSFQGWEPAGTPMMDNGDGTWSVTVEMEPGTYEFKFINSNAWDGNEENMEGTGCNAGGNRIASFDADNSTYTACFNTCPGESCVPDPDPADVTFRVNAANQELMEGDTLFLWGSFTGWQGGAIAMTDADADGIWEHTETISGGANVDYKYSIGHPNSEGMIEEDGVFILDGDTTNFEAAGCGAGNGFGGFNRRHVRSSVAEVLDVVCFNECSDCEGSDASVYDATVIFGLFPNPATDRVVLTGAQGNADVFVLDVQGREVMSLNNAPLNGRFELNVAGLEAGAYTVVIRQGLRQGAQRILVH
ncbi:MAG: T9SS type A sorting domain-containing protein [Flavobacteriales bacterium]|nr:T9SS type A sorting domain-containing protein [Flavobacteriales bacterium]